MAKEADKTPDYIAKHKKLYKHASELVDTAQQTHSEAYTNAVNKHLKNDKGMVDFEKLEDDKVQTLFVKTMSDMYITKAKQHFKVSEDLTDLEEGMLMQVYAGITTSELRNLVSRHRKGFTHAVFGQYQGRIGQQLQQRLYEAAGGHLLESQVPEIVKQVGLEGKIDSAKITLEEARGILEEFHKEGSVSDAFIREHVAQYKVKKKRVA